MYVHIHNILIGKNVYELSTYQVTLIHPNHPCNCIQILLTSHTNQGYKNQEGTRILWSHNTTIFLKAALYLGIYVCRRM